MAVFICCNFVIFADHFSECVESHAYETYDKFIKEQGGKYESFFIFFFFLDDKIFKLLIGKSWDCFICACIICKHKIEM